VYLKKWGVNAEAERIRNQRHEINRLHQELKEVTGTDGGVALKVGDVVTRNGRLVKVTEVLADGRVKADAFFGPFEPDVPFGWVSVGGVNYPVTGSVVRMLVKVNARERVRLEGLRSGWRRDLVALGSLLRRKLHIGNKVPLDVVESAFVDRRGPERRARYESDFLIERRGAVRREIDCVD